MTIIVCLYYNVTWAQGVLFCTLTPDVRMRKNRGLKHFLSLSTHTKLLVPVIAFMFTQGCGVKFKNDPDSLEAALNRNTTVPSTAGADHMIFFVQPSAAGTAGTALAVQPQVEIQDIGNARLLIANDPITITAFTNAGCTVAATGNLAMTSNPTSAVSGLATFANLSYDRAETIYLRATSGTITSACSNAITITAAAANRLAFTTQPSSIGTINTNLATQPVVQVQDSFGNPITGATDMITLAAFTNAACSAASGGALSATTNPLAAIAGSATFGGVRHNTVETIYIRASSGVLTSACSSAVVVRALPTIASWSLTSPADGTTSSDTSPLFGGTPDQTGTAEIYALADAACGTPLSSSFAVTAATAFTNQGLLAAMAGDGLKQFRYKITNSDGASTCATTGLSYTLDLTAPAVPSGLSLVTPSTSPGNDSTPTIRVSGVVSGDIVTIYSDNTCTVPNLKGSGTSAGVTIDLDSSALSVEATYNFYARSTDPYGNASACSAATVAYQYDVTPPATPTVVMTDQNTLDTTHTNHAANTITITLDTDAVKWCVMDDISTNPTPTTPAANDACFVTPRPTSYTLTGRGVRKVYVFTQDSATNVGTAGVATFDFPLPSVLTITGSTTALASGCSDACHFATFVSTPAFHGVIRFC